MRKLEGWGEHGECKGHSQSSPFTEWGLRELITPGASRVAYCFNLLCTVAIVGEPNGWCKCSLCNQRKMLSDMQSLLKFPLG